MDKLFDVITGKHLNEWKEGEESEVNCELKSEELNLQGNNEQMLEEVEE